MLGDTRRGARLAERRAHRVELLDHRYDARRSSGFSSGSSASATATRLERVLNELRRDQPARDDVHQTDMRNLDQPLPDGVVQRPGPIRDDERAAGHRRLERRRAALAQRRVGRAQHGERLRSHHLERTARRIERDVRRDAHHDFERPDSRAGARAPSRRKRRGAARSPARGFRERARARDRPRRSPSRSRASARSGNVGDAVEQRMADERRVDAVPREAAAPRTGGSPPPWSPFRAIVSRRPARDAHTCGVMKYSTGTPAAAAAAATRMLKAA